MVTQIAFLALGLIWGSNFLFMKMAVQVLDPYLVVCLRLLFGSIPLLLYSLSRRCLRWADLRHSQHFLAMAFLAVIVPYLGFVQGARYLPSGIAGAITGITPLMTALSAALFLPGETLGPRKKLGLLLGLVGVSLVARIDSFGAQPGWALGTLLMLTGSAGFAAALVYARKYIQPLSLPPLALACYQTSYACLAIALITPLQGVTQIYNHPKALAALVLGLGLLGTGIGFVLYYRILEKMGAVTASSVYYLPPVVALLIGALIAHEPLGLSQFAGVSAILVGVYLAQEKKST